MPRLETDVGRDAIEVDVRLDKVVLTVSEGDDSATTELTPAEARAVRRMLEQAADSAEQTPGS